MNYDNYYKNGGMTKEESVSAIALRIGAKKEAVAKFVEKNNIDTNKLNSDLKSGQVYFLDVITAIVGKPNNKYEKEIVKKYDNKMAMGGKTQGYDAREDERLGMEYGKMSGKDFDGSHAMREHSRRDDARFEERMAKGGEIAEYRVIPNKRGQGSLSHIVEADYKMAFTIKGSKQEAEMSAQSFVTENNETHPTATVTKIHPSGQPLKNKKVSYVTKNEISKFAEGGHIVEHDKMYNFLEDDLQSLQNAIEEGDFEEVNRFFSYWGQHLKSLETKTNERMYNFLEDDLKKLQTAIEEGDTEEVSKFFSYWNQHLQSLKMADGGQIDEDELHELARLVMKSIDYTVNISLDEFIDGVSMTGYQRELCEYVLKMFDSHEFAKGGAIENQYEGRTAKDIWESWNDEQKIHFFTDHKQHPYYNMGDEEFVVSKNDREKYVNMSYDNLPKTVKLMISDHVEEGEYAKGGAISEQKEMNKKVLALVQKANIDSKLEFGQLVVSALTDANAHSQVRKFISIIEKKPEWAEKPKEIDMNLPREEFKKQRAKTVYGSKYYDANEKIDDLGVEIANMSGWGFEVILDSLIFASKMSGRNDVAQVLEKLNTHDDKQDATKNKWEYTDKDEIEYVVVKDKSGKELKFDGKDVISGVHDLLEKGGKLTEIGKYYSKNDVVSVFVNGKNILDKNTVSGVWIKKDAKPMAGGGFVVVSENDGYWYIMSKPTSKQVAEEFLSTLTIPRGEVGKVVSVEDAKNHKKVIGRKYLKMADGGDVSEMKIGQTTVRKGFNGWVGKTMVDNFKGYDWDITTIKNSRGDLTTTAQGGKSEDKGGYKMFTFMLYQDPSVRLQTSRPARVNEKVVSEQHAEALKIFKEKVGNTPDKEKMADGGAIGFDALAKKVAKNYEGDEVKKQYQDEYGKTYDKKEAEEVGKKVAGKVYGQQQAKKKMAKGGKVAKKSGSPANRSQSKMTLISRKASEIRKANEPWRDAFNRAKAMLYS